MSKLAVISAPEIGSTGAIGLPSERSVALNDAPRAGQIWQISSIFYRFPFAKEELYTFTGGPPKKPVKGSSLEATISLILNQVLVAEQIIVLPKLLTKEIEEASLRSFPIAGAIEPFSGEVLFPGNGLEILYSIEGRHEYSSKHFIGGTTGEGTFYVSYESQDLRRGKTPQRG